MTDVQWISILFFLLCYFNYSCAEPAKRCDSYEGSEFAKAPDFLEEPAEEMMSDAESGGTETIVSSTHDCSNRRSFNYILVR